MKSGHTSPWISFTEALIFLAFQHSDIFEAGKFCFRSFLVFDQGSRNHWHWWRTSENSLLFPTSRRIRPADAWMETDCRSERRCPVSKSVQSIRRHRHDTQMASPVPAPVEAKKTLKAGLDYRILFSSLKSIAIVRNLSSQLDLISKSLSHSDYSSSTEWERYRFLLRR